MEGVIGWIQQSIDSNQMIAPVLFIAFHIIRPFLFIPVAFICITGGLLFGMTYGVVYSLIGVTLSIWLFNKHRACLNDLNGSGKKCLEDIAN